MIGLPQGLKIGKPVDSSPATEEKGNCFSCLMVERIKMLADGRFWMGVAVGAGGLYAWQRYKVKKAGG